MDIKKLNIDGAWIAKSQLHHDSRGNFFEWFKPEILESEVGKIFEVKQANISKSNLGSVRGIHFSLARFGQAKWLTCISGSIWDVIVDLRSDSPTFKNWVGIELAANSGISLIVSEGLGHGFISLQENTVVSYLLSSPYNPNTEFSLNPLDPDLSIPWPIEINGMSSKDRSAPSLVELERMDRLPRIKSFYD